MRSLIFDTETTDLIRNVGLPLEKQPHVVEYFGLELDWHKEADGPSELLPVEDGHFQSYFNPGVMMPPMAMKITGYTDAFLADKPTFRSAKDAIKQQFDRCDEYVAHNLNYDQGMLDFEFARCEDRLTWKGQRICTVESTNHLKGYRLNLTALHQLLFDEEFKGAHGAEADVRALARCFIELRKRGIV